MLSLVTDADGDVVYLHADSAGLEKLEGVIASLRRGLARGECEHSHLFTEAWGGGELAESMLSDEREANCKQVHHLKVYAWTEEWRQKHGL